MTSCHLQSNYSSTVTLHGGPVEFRPVRATPCLKLFGCMFRYDVAAQVAMLPVTIRY